MNKLTVFSLIGLTSILLLPTVGQSQKASRSCLLGTPYQGCPACGSVKSVKGQQDNLLKNRDKKPEDKIKTFKVSEIRDPSNDKSFFPDMAVEVSGYVAEVLPGPVKEKANCGRRDLRGVVISLVASPDEAKDRRKHVVLQITPRWEKALLGLDGGNYSTMLAEARHQLQGKWVIFQGWMFYDVAHIDESESTNPGNKSNWRATSWEIHPVTNYKVLARRPSK